MTHTVALGLLGAVRRAAADVRREILRRLVARGSPTRHSALDRAFDLGDVGRNLRVARRRRHAREERRVSRGRRHPSPAGPPPRRRGGLRRGCRRRRTEGCGSWRRGRGCLALRLGRLRRGLRARGRARGGGGALARPGAQLAKLSLEIGECREAALRLRHGPAPRRARAAVHPKKRP